MKDKNGLGLKRVLIVTAMEDEMNCIDKEGLKKKMFGIGCSVNFLVTGVGKIKASSALTEAVCNEFEYQYDIVINVGTCGGVERVNIFDVIYNSKVKSVDVDYCGGNFDYILDEYFGVDEFIRPGIMFSNDKFLTPEYYDVISSEMNSDSDVVGMMCPITYDMETFSNAMICDKYKIKFMSLRVVTDKPIVPNSYSVFEENLVPGMKKLNDILNSDNFLERLHEVNEHT